MSLLMQFVSAEALAECDMEHPITGNTCVDCESFEQNYLDAAKTADENGQSSPALVYRLLAAICSFHFKPQDATEPFSNRIGFADGSRSLTGSDFDQDQIDALRSCLPRIGNVSLKTRIVDLVWTRCKQYSDCARMAIDGYVYLVNQLIEGVGTQRFGEADPTGISAEEFLRRATVIARATGWSRPENDALKTALEDVLTLAAQRNDMAVVRIGNLVTDVRLDSADGILASLPSLVDHALSKPDYFIAEAIQRLIIRRAKRGGDESGAHTATLKLVSIQEAKADIAESAMLKTHALQEAIESLHGLKGVREERQRLHEKLKEAQVHLPDEFGRFEQKVDLTEEVRRLVAGYDGLDVFDALLRLAQTELPREPDALIKQAQEQAQHFPLSYLFATSIIDHKGRTVARASGGIENEDALRHSIIRGEQIRIGLAVAGAINPARERLTERYDLDYALIYELCLLSPFVPSGTEHAFARGILALLYGDDFIATATLIPLLESGLRTLVEVAGGSDTRISSGGIEAAIGFSPLLSEHRDVLEQVFGKSVVFAIENLFVHELGPKIRHNYCHGLSRDHEFSSEVYIYGTKLIFSLVLLPLAGAIWEAVKTEVKGKLGRPDHLYCDQVGARPQT